MTLMRVAGTTAALACFAAAIATFAPHPARSADLADSPTLVAHPTADINDVYMFPSPQTSGNVVLVMDVDAGIAPGQGTSASFDPAVLYQFKIRHSTQASQFASSASTGAAGSAEDTVIQFTVNQVGASQVLTMYGPAKPNQIGTTSTLVATTASAGIGYNKVTNFSVNDVLASSKTDPVKVFAGPVADPSFFDLAQFYAAFPDRNAQNHVNGTQINPPIAASFRGFANGTCTTSAPGVNIAGGHSPTNAAIDYFSSGGADITTGSNGLNVLSIVVELPQTLLAENASSGTSSNYVSLWATTSTASGV